MKELNRNFHKSHRDEARSIAAQSLVLPKTISCYRFKNQERLL
jgi:hypothetical protein